MSDSSDHNPAREPARNPDLAAMRSDYARAALDEAQVAHDPFAQFERWLHEAINGGCPEPTAMSLATVDRSGAAARPSSRIVLLKGVEADGLVFFTNYESRKGRELAANPHAALLFYWAEMEREVRIEGRIEKIAAAESDVYYAKRPLKARLGAWASPQSAAIDSRAWLEQQFIAAQAQHGNTPVRPPHWGGYRLIPTWFEFWQGRPDRLHDRITFARNDGTVTGTGSGTTGWTVQRLAP